LLIALFLFITAPVTAYMLIKAGLHQKVAVYTATKNQNLMQESNKRTPK
jgi:multisubunit Na+/H+ antiporter MnhG subunit